MSETRRKVYKPDFKAKVGIEAIRGRKTTNELGQEYGVGRKRVQRLMRKLCLAGMAPGPSTSRAHS